ncbi:tetratricopeptide repeat protein [Spectribacter hydrogenooxidans]|uniref:Tetratricopeptide repeat protein n=1 Tax=Spectribacter hydrogenoxidans TaxID=3075608 RepID=A0ABU3BW88_9GAMM|nr:tetratricopeptide repeat protein [Salinisphaera sp. W335]MDT0633555.1 tetratricopeptide repeat protein [Salinisphaera sp. W335]
MDACKGLGATLLLAALLGPGSVLANAEAIVEKLAAGDSAAALDMAEQALASNPGESRLRFLKARALAQAGDTDAAINLFGELAREHPDRPEPANNLAVLYSRQNDYEQARRWLEAAMETHPAYATAHRNLGDVYTALAAVAYSKALDPEGRPEDLGVQLEMVSSFDGRREAAAPPQVVDAPAPTPEPALPPGDEAPEMSPDEEPVTAATADEDEADHDVRAAIRASVQQWARAWSEQDVEAYLGSYAADFRPADGRSRTAWADNRRERVAAPERIRVGIDDFRITLLDDATAEISFRQHYQSDTYEDRVRKTLLMARTDDGWQILRETDEPL